MAAILGVLVFALLVGGLSMLMAVPLVFAWLGYALVREAWGPGARFAAPEGVTLAEPPPSPPPAAEPERPRVMVAGRRQPLR